MKALVKAAPEPGALELREVPAPTPAEDEVLLDVRSASICGSDLHIAHWHAMARWTQTPVILGHEVAGVVRQVGAGVRGIQPGEAVAVESVIWCGACAACRTGRTNLCANRQLLGIHQPGGLAEQIVVPERLVHRLPPTLAVGRAALVEPLAVAVHAVMRHVPTPGDVVLVTGPGPLGLLAAQVASAAGARVLVAGAPADAQARLPAARALGLETLDPEQSLAESVDLVGGSVDLVLECSGANAALSGAMQVVRRGGMLTLVGMPAADITIDLPTALRGELTLHAAYAGTWQDFERAIAYLADGTVQTAPLVTDYSLHEVLRAFEDAASQRVLKPVIHPDGEAS